MDGFQFYEQHQARTAIAPGEARSFLFLQGPISTFFDRLGRALIARGHRVQRINLHFGDQLFWRLPATHYRGRFCNWREFVGAYLDEHNITDLVLHGDRLPYHIVAAEEARARGIAVIATDLGYVRPDWITLEYDGMTTYSRFPRDPAIVRELAAKLPEPDLKARFHTPFWMIASLDVAYNIGLIFGRPLFPHYRYHSICHPFTEYAGWLWSRTKRLFTAPAANAEKYRLQAAPGSYFLVPLQLATDYQLRAHSPFRDGRDAVERIIASYAASGSTRDLVFIAHPLDNGLIGWGGLVARLGRQYGVAERVRALPGGTPAEVLKNAAGVVTINSTIGITALSQGVAVKVLGNAVFDIPGLTAQAPLDAFWHDPTPPDPSLMTAFMRALTGTTQVKGGYYERQSQDCAIANFIDRFEHRPYPLPALTAADFAARPPRAAARTIVVAGVSNGIGLALARAHAAPGIRVCLIGADPASVERAAADCRHRGAVVESLCADSEAAVCEFLAELDERTPIDGLLVQVDAEGAPGAGINGGDIGAAVGLVASLADPLRRRGRGEVVLLSSLTGHAAADPAAALRARKTLLAHGRVLRQRLWAQGVGVAVVVPGSLGLRLAGWLDEPSLAARGPDRIGEAIGRGLRRQEVVIAVPGAASVAVRLVRRIALRLRDGLRAITAPAVEAAVPDKSGAGD